MKNKMKKYLIIFTVIAFVLFGFGRMNALKNTSRTVEKTLSDIGIEYYMEKIGDQGLKDIEAVVRNFGCHREIHIFRDGNLVMRLTYSNGRVYEL